MDTGHVEHILVETVVKGMDDFRGHQAKANIDNVRNEDLQWIGINEGK